MSVGPDPVMVSGPLAVAGDQYTVQGRPHLDPPTDTGGGLSRRWSAARAALCAANLSTC
jgi:hypothetical protein